MREKENERELRRDMQTYCRQLLEFVLFFLNDAAV